MPLNLLEPYAATPPRGQLSSPLELAHALGLAVMAHRPLNAIPPTELAPPSRGKKQYLVLRETRPMKPTLALLRQAVTSAGLGAGAQRDLDQLALLFAASAPGVDVALCGMRTTAYVERAMALVEGAWVEAVTPETHREAASALRTLLSELDPGAQFLIGEA